MSIFSNGTQPVRSDSIWNLTYKILVALRGDSGGGLVVDDSGGSAIRLASGQFSITTDSTLAALFNAGGEDTFKKILMRNTGATETAEFRFSSGSTFRTLAVAEEYEISCFGDKMKFSDIEIGPGTGTTTVDFQVYGSNILLFPP